MNKALSVVGPCQLSFKSVKQKIFYDGNSNQHKTTQISPQRMPEPITKLSPRVTRPSALRPTPSLCSSFVPNFHSVIFSQPSTPVSLFPKFVCLIIASTLVLCTPRSPPRSLSKVTRHFGLVRVWYGHARAKAITARKDAIRKLIPQNLIELALLAATALVARIFCLYLQQ